MEAEERLSDVTMGDLDAILQETMRQRQSLLKELV